MISLGSSMQNVQLRFTSSPGREISRLLIILNQGNVKKIEFSKACDIISQFNYV